MTGTGKGKGNGATRQLRPAPKATGRNCARVPRQRPISEAERKRRAAQSRRDKAMSGSQVLRRPGYQPLMTGNGKGRRPGTGGGLRAHIQLLRKTIPFSAPTRREPIYFRGSLNLSTGSSPIFLFHPSRSTTNWAVLGRENSVLFADVQRRVQASYVSHETLKNGAHPSGSHAGHPDPGQDGGHGNWTHWWVDDKAVKPDTGNDQSLTTNPTNMVAQGVGTPAVVVSDGVRVLGGLASIQMQCGPTIRGFIHYRILAGPESHVYSSVNISAEINSPYFYRKALKPGVNSLTFHAPVENPSALEYFGRLTRTLSDEDAPIMEPFSTIVFCFSAVEWAANDSPPMVTFSSCVNLQCMLPTSVRHLATKEPKTTREELHKAYTSSVAGEIMTGAERIGDIGGLLKVVEFGAEAAGIVAAA